MTLAAPLKAGTEKGKKTALQSNFNNIFIRPSQTTEKKSWACLVP